MIYGPPGSGKTSTIKGIASVLDCDIYILPISKDMLDHDLVGAFTHINEKKITIWNAQPFDSQITYDENQIGEIVEKFFSGDFIVKCQEGSLLVTEYEGEISIGEIFSDF